MKVLAVVLISGLCLVVSATSQALACGGGCSCRCYMPMMMMPSMNGHSMTSPSAPNMNGMSMPGMKMTTAPSASKTTAGKTRRALLAVSGMHCDDCATRVQKALASVPGVKQVLVDFDRQEAIVIAESGQYDEQALLNALKKAGYGGKVTK